MAAVYFVLGRFLWVDQLTENRLSDQKQKLTARINDVNFWRREVVSETEKLEVEMRNVDVAKQRIDRIIMELEGPLKASLDCTGIRRLKKDENAVMYLDGVDYGLGKVKYYKFHRYIQQYMPQFNERQFSSYSTSITNT